MKRWLFYPAAVLLVAVLGWMPFAGTDVAQLQPVELVRISAYDNRFTIETDTGQSGTGMTLEAAFADLQATTAGKIFLETADHILLGENLQPDAEIMAEYLRPGCSLCREMEKADLEEAAAFLGVHQPNVTLQAYRARQVTLPQLYTEGGRMRLVTQSDHQ